VDLVVRAPDLARWERRPFWPGISGGPAGGDARDCLRRDVAVEPPGQPVPGGPFERVAAAILAYRVFPPALVEAVLRRAPVEPHDTVGIRYKGFPIVDLFFAARVVERFRRAGDGLVCEGFTYRTLVGHGARDRPGHGRAPLLEQTGHSPRPPGTADRAPPPAPRRTGCPGSPRCRGVGGG